MGDVDAVTWPLPRPVGPLSVLPSRARRCLFGSVDHKKAKMHLNEEIEKILIKNKLRWNFDFEAGEPLPAGQYKWELVDPKIADSNGESPPPIAQEEITTSRERQTHIPDFLRKRKSSNQTESATSQKTRRRSST